MGRRARDDCLREFAVMLKMARASCALVDAVAAEMLGPDIVQTRPRHFRWIDDDLGAVHIHIRTSAEQPADGAAERKA